MPPLDEAIVGAVTGVTKRWAKQRKAEEREASAARRRRSAFTPARYTIKDAAAEVMREAYLKVSNNGRLPANARQIMYAARPHIQDATGKELKDTYFTQVLLPDYIEDHGLHDWKVVFDARGHFSEPHTGHDVDLGTLDVRRYLADIQRHEARPPVPSTISMDFPTRGPADRFAAVLFIEKEGFDALLSAARIAGRFDVAIMSTKGMSVTASRELVERLRVPLFVLHDFDQAGFSIIGTLRRSTRRYQFTRLVKVIDAGLRLEDIESYGLASEYQHCTQDDWTLVQNGATREDIAYLKRGQRVELNALASDQFVELIERRLTEHGVRKVIPEPERLEEAWRRAYQIARINRAIAAAAEDAAREAAAIHVPDDLADILGARLSEEGGLAWDVALAELIKDAVEEGNGS
jgi:hypothetical protein